MNITDKKTRRLIYAGLWLPVLLPPVAYIVFACLIEGTFRMNSLWHFARFVIPFCLLFCIHHFLLVKRLFMQNRMNTYIIAVACLLGVFCIVNNLYFARDHHPRMADSVVSEMRRPQMGPERFRPAPPPDKQHNEDERHMKGPIPVALDFIIALLLIGANLSVALFLKYVDEKERYADMEKNHLQQELEYLKAQLNPHFFMNMLNNIHGMVEIDPPAAQEMIVELSRLMRYVLYEGAKEYIPLAVETDFISTYVTLMRKRYSNKKVSIAFRMPQQSQTMGIMIPPLLFIVLVENAFKHGISYLQHSAFDIFMDVRDGQICFHCRNNRTARPKANTQKQGGIGLKNLRKRLDLLYGQNYSLVTDENDDTYAITLTIPYKHETDKMPGHR